MRWVYLVTALLLSSCTAVFNPYSSKFQCPPTDPGKCVGMKEAYKESLLPVLEPQSSNETRGERNLYLEEKYKLLSDLIHEPRPPVVKPPKVLRVLVLNYVADSNMLYGWRYVYFFADEPTWVIDPTEGVQ